jgi:hypothetical protein
MGGPFRLGSIMTVVRKFRALPVAEKRLVLLTAPVVVGLRVALYVLPSAFIVRSLGHRAFSEARQVEAAAVSPNSITRIVEAVSARVPGASCLTQALSARLLLAHFGYSSRLCLGVARGSRGFRAHAWLEHDGKVIIGGNIDGFTRLPELSVGRSPLPGS